jgi:hypothetical protein
MHAQTAVRERSAAVGPRDRDHARLPARRTGLILVGALLVLSVGPARAEDHLGEAPRMAPRVETQAPDALDAATSELRDQVTALNAEVNALAAERDRLRAAVGVLEDLYTPIEADRLLLTELRKEVPVVRGEAEAYLARLRRLALESDPSRLGPITDRLLEVAPVYLDWRDTDFATTEEATRAFIQTGASGFDTKFRELRDAILLSVANRLDGLLNIVDRAR